LNIDAGGGTNNRLIIDDSGNSTSSRTVTISSNSITGIGPGPIGYSATGGSFNDPSGSDGILITSSSTQPATFNIQSTLAGSTTLIQNGGAVDIYKFSSSAPTPGGIVDGIQGLLTVAGSGEDSLSVDDSGSTTAKTGTLTPSMITGLGMGP